LICLADENSFFGMNYIAQRCGFRDQETFLERIQEIRTDNRPCFHKAKTSKKLKTTLRRAHAIAKNIALRWNFS
jgi:hypothetical protein